MPATLAALLVVVPLLGLLAGTQWQDLPARLTDPAVRPAITLSVVTTLATVVVCWVLGTPLAWLLSRIPPGSTVLMVGMNAHVGATDNLVEEGLAAVVRACALVYDPGGIWAGRTIRADALRLPFPDGCFDFVVSNAVIEHVGGVDPAAVMVAESRRVARVAAVHTTPYRWFPVETHSKVPLLHWLPRRAQHRAFAAVGVPWFRPEEYWLFDRRDVARLSPRAPRVHRVGVSLVAEWQPSVKG